MTAVEDERDLGDVSSLSRARFFPFFYLYHRCIVAIVTIISSRLDTEFAKESRKKEKKNDPTGGTEASLIPKAAVTCGSRDDER